MDPYNSGSPNLTTVYAEHVVAAIRLAITTSVSYDVMMRDTMSTHIHRAEETGREMVSLVACMARGEQSVETTQVTRTVTQTVTQTAMFEEYASWWDHTKAVLTARFPWLKLSVSWRPVTKEMTKTVSKDFEFTVPVTMIRACPHVSNWPLRGLSIDGGNRAADHALFLFPTKLRNPPA